MIRTAIQARAKMLSNFSESEQDYAAEIFEQRLQSINRALEKGLKNNTIDLQEAPKDIQQLVIKYFNEEGFNVEILPITNSLYNGVAYNFRVSW